VLAARREHWDAVPSSVVLLTAGVDVQDDRLEVTVLGWSGNQSVHVLGHSQLWGSPGEPAVWSEMDDLLRQAHHTSDGRQLRIRAACVDSGGHHTQKVYDFCRPLTGRNVWAVKGRSGSYPIWPTRTTKPTKTKGIALFMVGVDSAKDTLRAMCAVKNKDLPHYVGFSADLPDTYFQQLTAERRITKYNTRGQAERVWKKAPGVRNEALDCWVYALAALEGLKSRGIRLSPVLRAPAPASAAPRPARQVRHRVSSAIL
jgi:phage terminase large subunit GpA-like protein